MKGKIKIEVGTDVRRKIVKMFGVCEQTVTNALNYSGGDGRGQNELARKIRRVAMENGGRRMAYLPEEEIFYDTEKDGERFMRQYFSNGAVLEVSLRTGAGVVVFKGEPVGDYERVLVSELPGIQNFARSLR